MHFVLVVWLLCQPATLISQQTPVQQTKPYKQNTQADQHGSLFSRLISSIESVQANTQAQEADSQHREEAETNWWIMIFTGALAGIALFQLGMFAVQLWQIGASLKHTRLAAEAAVNTERPHIIFTDVIVERTGQGIPDYPDELYLVHFAFTNYGRTPAFPIRIGFGMKVGKQSDLPAEPEYTFVPDTEHTFVPDQGFLRPGDTTRFQLHKLLGITPDQQRVIGKDGTSMWFWGQIRYTDVFDSVADTGFIAYYNPAVYLPNGEEIHPATLTFSGPVNYTYRRYHLVGTTPSTKDC